MLQPTDARDEVELSRVDYLGTDHKQRVPVLPTLGGPVTARDGVHEVISLGFAVVVVDEQRHASVLIADLLQRGADPVIPLVDRLPYRRGRHHLRRPLSAPPARSGSTSRSKRSRNAARAGAVRAAGSTVRDQDLCAAIRERSVRSAQHMAVAGPRVLAGQLVLGGRSWVRTSDPLLVREVLYR
jgi:hypothetical protein